MSNQPIYWVTEHVEVTTECNVIRIESVAEYGMVIRTHCREDSEHMEPLDPCDPLIQTIDHPSSTESAQPPSNQAT